MQKRKIKNGKEKERDVGSFWEMWGQTDFILVWWYEVHFKKAIMLSCLPTSSIKLHHGRVGESILLEKGKEKHRRTKLKKDKANWKKIVSEKMFFF